MSKTDLPKLDKAQNKKPKKKTGKPAGTRQQEAMKKAKPKASNQATKDPRIGSKKPIDLGIKVTSPSPKKKVKTAQAIAPIKVIDESTKPN